MGNQDKMGGVGRKGHKGETFLFGVWGHLYLWIRRDLFLIDELPRFAFHWDMLKCIALDAA